MLSKRTHLMIKLKLYSLLGKNHEKADLCRESGLFKSYGSGGYWHPDWVPSFPQFVSIGDNVTLAADVRLYEHDMIQRMWNEDSAYIGPKVKFKTGDIEIGDNSVICARSIILYDVKIGRNVVVAGGSVVTKDIPDFAIVAGAPAKVIGDTRNLLRKRLSEDGNDIKDFEYESFFS